MPINFNLKEIREQYKIKIFFETGFFYGASVNHAMEAGFEKMYSIEIASYFYGLGYINFKHQLNSKFLNLIKDDSQNIYDHIKNINEPILFWLDAHADQPSDIEKGEHLCPLLKELDGIKNHEIKNHVILIDDVRILRKDCWGEKNLDIDKIKEKILSINPDYKFKYLNGYVKDDVLMAYI